MDICRLTKNSESLNFDLLADSGMTSAGRSFKLYRHCLLKYLIIEIDGIEGLFGIDVPSIVDDVVLSIKNIKKSKN